MHTRLLAGTSKGLIVLSNESGSWKIVKVFFEGLPVSMLYIDERTNTWWVGIGHRHWGEKLHFSTDDGMTWLESSTPSFKDYFFRPGMPATLKKLWVMQHAGTDKPGCLWLGTEPGGLFFSSDSGKSWQLTESLWNHPSRVDDKQWFGAGKDFPFIHSIVIDPRNSNHVFIGISCAGVFRTIDGGKNWQAKNKGLFATYLPNPSADVGHDPHKLLQCQARPDVIWQQNHCGIFRTEDAAENWVDVSGKNGFPSYGFALAIDNENPEVAWVIPAQSDEMRVPCDLRLTICKTTNGGSSWASVNAGLPASYSFDLVLRQAFDKSQKTLAFGTNNGNLYLSENDGESWQTISQNLATVNCIIFC
ncbi:MAG: glycosyl hydrolase [Cyclobacteriaceae bacterium]|nr:glycosyl hydrolase [Cyclobacteriaceae bacterium]MDH4296860.1 glycosyl hydrolase [Cyclobacteriaceae bacterium]MDH5251453.1 glycosyl hydrolase [Cyclobacteriaceae bacterium]